MPDFTDRQEYISVVNEIRKPPEPGLKRGEKYWEGPKKKHG
jgi:hypothetical protein